MWYQLGAQRKHTAAPPGSCTLSGFRMLLPALLEPTPPLSPAQLCLSLDDRSTGSTSTSCQLTKEDYSMNTHIFLQLTSQVGCWKFPVLQSMFLADQHKQSLDFLLKAEAFATALFVPTLLQLLHPLADPENSTCERQHSLTLHPCKDEAERLLRGSPHSQSWTFISPVLTGRASQRKRFLIPTGRVFTFTSPVCLTRPRKNNTHCFGVRKRQIFKK